MLACSRHGQRERARYATAPRGTALCAKRHACGAAPRSPVRDARRATVKTSTDSRLAVVSLSPATDTGVPRCAVRWCLSRRSLRPLHERASREWRGTQWRGRYAARYDGRDRAPTARERLICIEAHSEKRLHCAQRKRIYADSDVAAASDARALSASPPARAARSVAPGAVAAFRQCQRAAPFSLTLSERRRRRCCRSARVSRPPPTPAAFRFDIFMSPSARPAARCRQIFS